MPFIFYRKESYLQGHSRALGAGQVGEGSGPGGSFTPFSLVLLRRSHRPRGIWVCGCDAVCLSARTIFDSSFWGICTEKQQREHFKEAARLSCCSDNCGVIENHLCKLWCPPNGACRKCGYSFSRPIFFSCKIILRFSFSEQLKKYYVLARE